MFSVVVLLCEPYMIPIILLAIFLKTLFVQRVKQDLYRATVTSNDDGVCFRMTLCLLSIRLYVLIPSDGSNPPKQLAYILHIPPGL